MNLKSLFGLCLLLGIQIQCVYMFFDPITIGAAAGIGSLIYYFKDKALDTFDVERCNSHHIPGNVEYLKEDLNRHLFGQHIVVDHLIPALRAHFSGYTQSRKPLVISFHGTPGVGKNYVADMIAYSLYTSGVKSKFVHKYLGRADFPRASEAESYKVRINREVRKAIAECPRSLFIFDEVDKMPEGVFESLTSLLDYHSQLDGNDFTKAIFIFLSNTAGVQIADHLGKILKQGTIREDAKLSQFENILSTAAYNQKGGFRRTSLIEAHVIDHYLPFLPLEKRHVSLCIRAEFKRYRAPIPSEEDVISIIDDSITYDSTHKMFATSGCKTLEKKVAVKVHSNQFKTII